VAVILFSLAVTGLINIFVASKSYVRHAHMRMLSAQLGKVFLDPFQYHVHMNTWGAASPNNRLSNPANATNQVANIDGNNYTASYAIINDYQIPNINKVRANINWNE